jgi:hypothetical protein
LLVHYFADSEGGFIVLRIRRSGKNDNSRDNMQYAAHDSLFHR